MDKELVQVAVGPVLTAVVTGCGVLLRQAWQDRDERQRASRQLHEAAQQVQFISAWAAVQDQLSSPDEREAARARARRDLQAIYESATSSMVRSNDVLERKAGWEWARLLNAVVALRVRVAPQRPPAGDGQGAVRPTYRRPLGLARVLRPGYWLLLALAVVWAIACFAVLPSEGEGFWATVGWSTMALVFTLVGGVLPVAGFRALVLYVDEVVAQRRGLVVDTSSTARVPRQGPVPESSPELRQPTY